MKSKDYLQLLLNEYESRELTREDLKNTLLHFANLYHKENIYKIKLRQEIFPLAFLTPKNKVFIKSELDVSADGTPRYIPNPKASGTYSLDACMKDYKPIYNKKDLKIMQLKSK